MEDCSGVSSEIRLLFDISFTKNKMTVTLLLEKSRHLKKKRIVQVQTGKSPTEDFTSNRFQYSPPLPLQRRGDVDTSPVTHVRRGI